MTTATDRDHGGPVVVPRTGGRPDRALTRLGGRISGRRLYVPTVVIAVAAAWLGWQGWWELSEFGVARSVDASRFQLAGPVVLGFVLVVFLARTVGIFGFKLPYSTGLANLVLVIEIVAIIALAITGALLLRRRLAR
jgi:hypothetical protein